MSAQSGCPLTPDGISNNLTLYVFKGDVGLHSEALPPGIDNVECHSLCNVVISGNVRMLSAYLHIYTLVRMHTPTYILSFSMFCKINIILIAVLEFAMNMHYLS